MRVKRKINMVSSQQYIKHELLKFGETVSVKGVSRIIKAKSKLPRALWLAAVITSMCILLWQLTAIFAHYLRWPVDTVVKESGDHPLFPDVTFCNTYPVRALKTYSEKMNMTYFLNVSQTQQKPLSKSREFWSGTNLTTMQKEYSNLRVFFSSKTAYILNFPIFERNFTFDDGLIFKQQVYNWHWKYECQAAIPKLRWNPNYIGCTTLRIPDECQRQTRGIYVMLYLENFPEVVQLEYSSSSFVSQATGVLFAVHANGTEPDLRTLHSVGPGTETNVRLSPITRSRLPSPYGDCTYQTYIDDDESSATDSDDERLVYTKDLCFEICFQQQIVNACGCMSTTFSFTRQQRQQTNGTVCGNFSMLETSPDELTPKELDSVLFPQISKGFQDYRCSMRAQLDLDSCEAKCRSQCEATKYDMTVTSAPWPHVTSQLAFSQTLMNTSMFNSRFAEYAVIRQQFLRLRKDNETIRMLDDLHLIEKNFLLVNLFFDSYSSIVLKDVPSLNAEKMMGLIGGVLSLWLGVTIMTLVEVVEFICTLVNLYAREKKIFPHSDQQTTKVPPVANN